MPEVRPPEPPAHFQFSLRAVLVVMTLVAVVAACFAWDTTAGIFGYLACVTLMLSVIRGRAEWRRNGDIRMAGGPAYPPAHVVLVGGAVALAAAIAFCGTCTVAQVPFTTIAAIDANDKKVVVLAQQAFQRGLFLSMPIGTAALAFVYLLTWPQKYRRLTPAKRDGEC